LGKGGTVQKTTGRFTESLGKDLSKRERKKTLPPQHPQNKLLESGGVEKGQRGEGAGKKSVRQRGPVTHPCAVEGRNRPSARQRGKVKKRESCRAALSGRWGTIPIPRGSSCREGGKGQRAPRKKIGEKRFLKRETRKPAQRRKRRPAEGRF